MNSLLSYLLLGAALLLPSIPHGHAADAAEPSPLRLRVLSFNLRFANSGDKEERSWTNRREDAAKLILEDAPDLIGYQEALRPMLDDLSTRVPGYQEIGVGREDGKTKGEYSSLWVKSDRFKVEESGTFWLSDTPELPNSMTWGNEITRICTWARLLDKPSGRVLHFYNIHFDHQSQESRVKSAAQVMKHMESRATTGPWVLTGDFNAGEDNPAITLIKASPLQPVDSWRLLHPDIPPAESGTFHSFTGVRHEAKIDYIFVPKSTRLIEASILHNNRNGHYPSDHYPVRATLEFAP